MVSDRNGRKPRLELTWIGKDEGPRLEPRILLPVAEHSHAKGTSGDGGIHDNILIQGDNLLALKALEQKFAGKVKCVFIDPPYNTGAAFEHYDDGVEHSLWLSLMRDRLELLRRLLSDDGSIWITVDDHEVHYLKLVCDEVFGRANGRAFVTWQRKYSVSNNFRGIASLCDFVLVYGKSDLFKNNLLPRTEESAGRYTNPDNDSRGPWKAVDYLNQASPAQRPNLCYDIVNPNTGFVARNDRKAWKYDPESHARHIAEKRIWWGASGTNTVPALKLFLSEVRDGMTPHNWWPHEEVGHTDEAKKESMAIFGATNAFGTPKPERLLKRVLELSTSPGDLVLDSFAGSGTTGAVAHKMGRRWIMVELGAHATTHIVPRLKKVIDGQDSGGVTEATGWKGGGGFRFYKLAPSLIAKDQFGQKIISKEYQPEMLVEAMCKHMSYTYAPAQDRKFYWQQGHSTERDFIYVTTQSMTHDALKALSLEVGPDRTLLVCCKAFRARLGDFQNLTVKKIPQAVLENCEWGRDDYSLNIAKPPEDTAAAPDDEPGSDDDGGNGGEPAARPRGRRSRAAVEPPVEANAAPIKKAPLKMDGTTRAPRPTKAPTIPADPVAVPQKAAARYAAKTTPPAPSPQKAEKSAKKPGTKAATTAKVKTPAKASKPTAAKAKPAPKSKPRRPGDDRQGRLL